MADAAPWIALAASLAFLAVSIRVLLWIADRPPIVRHRTVIGVCARLDLAPPANRNQPRPEIFDDTASVGG
ncbi:putative nicotinamide N-methyase [Methylorubrum rhodinum]|uniref:Putative nicotinamide N-methyase n=1 Tax=Methylorubrum rhodinum TaxID=29428 RepID=A0A840ZNS4_9HYPH|nr:hypothetical protein [Methylorubrum rhodinum]MBB5758814.1 putative nicotinamide N-methyase [Methylorubrum rhodinum]